MYNNAIVDVYGCYMKLMTEKYYHKSKKNLFCFFQPKPKISAQVVGLQDAVDSLPNPMDRYRVPVLRLVPRGYTR